MTTIFHGEEGPIFTTLAIGEEGPTFQFGEHRRSIQIIENPPSVVTAEFGPIFDPGGPVERQVKTAARRASRRRKK